MRINPYRDSANKVAKLTNVIGRLLTFATLAFLVLGAVEWLLRRRGNR
ncbi:MAG: hypothetical protein IT475_13805 [Aquimonas sp.]|nr:hypothetical protein [Aquimonas sp.]